MKINKVFHCNKYKLVNAKITRSFCKIHNDLSPIKLLEDRGLLSGHSHEIMTNPNFVMKYIKKDTLKRPAVYTGFDPTAPYIHLGNLMSLVSNIRVCMLYNFEQSPILLIGGATGLIGDPSGKSTERPQIQQEQLQDNIAKITENLSKISNNTLHFLEQDIHLYGMDQKLNKIRENLIIKNNIDFYKDMNSLEFLRDIGKHFRVSTLLAKDSVANRMKSEQGISFTEFSYQLQQAYDFQQLYKTNNCIMQVGGSDQWGNITSGIEFIRKTLKKECYGLTIPLLLTSTGEKFGKSEGNALYLNFENEALLAIHQYLINFPDDQVESLLKKLTFLPISRIDEIMEKHQENTQLRHAHRILIEEVIGMITGSRNYAKKMLKYSEYFKIDLKTLWDEKSDDELREYFENMQNYHENYEKSNDIVDILVDLENSKKSNNALRKLIKGKGIQINGTIVNLDQLDIKSYQKNESNFYIIRMGKRNYFTINLK